MPAKKSSAAKKTTAKQNLKKKATKKVASPKARTASTKATKKAGDQEITIDRRTKADRHGAEAESAETKPKVERREKVQRRRQIDPTTCERDYSEQEVQFMNAMDEYKRTSGRMFPTCSEVLEVIRDLGYVQLTPAELTIVRPEATQESEVTQDSDANQDSLDTEGTEEDALEEAELAF